MATEAAAAAGAPTSVREFESRLGAGLAALLAEGDEGGCLRLAWLQAALAALKGTHEQMVAVVPDMGAALRHQGTHWLRASVAALDAQLRACALLCSSITDVAHYAMYLQLALQALDRGQLLRARDVLATCIHDGVPAGAHAGPAYLHAGPASPRAGPASPRAGPASPHAGPASPHAGPASPHAGLASPHAGPAALHAGRTAELHAGPAALHAGRSGAGAELEVKRLGLQRWRLEACKKLLLDAVAAQDGSGGSSKRPPPFSFNVCDESGEIVFAALYALRLTSIFVLLVLAVSLTVKPSFDENKKLLQEQEEDAEGEEELEAVPLWWPSFCKLKRRIKNEIVELRKNKDSFALLHELDELDACTRRLHDMLSSGGGDRDAMSGCASEVRRRLEEVQSGLLLVQQHVNDIAKVLSSCRSVALQLLGSKHYARISSFSSSSPPPESASSSSVPDEKQLRA